MNEIQNNNKQLSNQNTMNRAISAKLKKRKEMLNVCGQQNKTNPYKCCVDGK